MIEIPPYRSSVLNVGELMQFHAPVEETALKRRTSRLLLPLPVSQRKPKVRELALTSHRLVSLKPLKSGRGVGIKAEFVLREFQGQLAVGSSGREKRSKGDEVRKVTGIERKGTKEFVVLTVSRFSYVFASAFFRGCGFRLVFARERLVGRLGHRDLPGVWVCLICSGLSGLSGCTDSFLSLGINRRRSQDFSLSRARRRRTHG
jgi:hypothetical protein